MIKILSLILSVLFILSSPLPAIADCTSPASPEGGWKYFSGAQVFKYCDGTDWQTIDTPLDSSGDDVYYLSGSGNFGIQTSTPTVELEVVGTIKATSFSGDGSGLTGLGGGVPSGAVMAFDLASCPSGWTAYASGVDRFIVGSGSTYSLNNTGGSATHTLTAAEMPSHTHSVDPPSTSTNTTGNHNHTFPLNTGVDGGANRPTQFNVENPINSPTSSAGNHSHTVNIAAFNSASAGSGNAHENRPPYIALLYCKKD